MGVPGMVVRACHPSYTEANIAKSWSSLVWVKKEKNYKTLPKKSKKGWGHGASDTALA
jgi:hypothetical protein